ncbi:MAG: aminotransferase class I/II-fold pyridoxal phosphate-dependent enzyme [Verrucomicrobiota bacterium]
MPSPEQLLPWLKRMQGNGRFTNFGPLCREFEQRLADSFSDGDVHVATASSGTTAISLALRALELPKDARILTPSLTFPGTASAILTAGGIPVFADVEAESWKLTPQIAKHILTKTHLDAVLPIAIFGSPADSSGWDDFTAKTGIPVVVDAAGAFGNQSIGESAVTAFSLHATKPLATGEGGFVVSKDAKLIERFRSLTNFGFDNGLVHHAGTNGKLSEYHAAVGLAALEDWSEKARKRRELASKFIEMTKRLRVPASLPADHWNWIRSVWVLRLRHHDAEVVLRELGARGVEARRWYCPPLHLQPAFSHCELAGDLRVTDQLSAELIGLPFHPFLSDTDCSRIEVALLDSLRA